MRFTVLWSPLAERQLMTIWSDAADRREEVTRAAEAIDRMLRDDPQDIGRPYDGDRIWTTRPLSVVYSIDEGDRKVKVLVVKLIT
jgi:hypothetical protein